MDANVHLRNNSVYSDKAALKAEVTFWGSDFLSYISLDISATRGHHTDTLHIYLNSVDDLAELRQVLNQAEAEAAHFPGRLLGSLDEITRGCECGRMRGTLSAGAGAGAGDRVFCDSCYDGQPGIIALSYDRGATWYHPAGGAPAASLEEVLG